MPLNHLKTFPPCKSSERKKKNPEETAFSRVECWSKCYYHSSTDVFRSQAISSSQLFPTSCTGEVLGHLAPCVCLLGMNLDVLREGCSPEDFMCGWSHTDVFCVSA